MGSPAASLATLSSRILNLSETVFTGELPEELHGSVHIVANAAWRRGKSRNGHFIAIPCKSAFRCCWRQGNTQIKTNTRIRRRLIVQRKLDLLLQANGNHVLALW